ncbi:MAG: PIN domain-containing protein [Alphaproteobacteria bacterium]|nr:PIN domain-containing protein [Alphaproteobacteria bacterium]
MYLFDTDVISASAPARRSNPALLDWMHRNSEQLYLSAITVAEIEDGIAKARRQGASRKAQLLSQWLEVLLHLYSERVLPFDVAAARIAGGLSDMARSKGQSPGFPDIAIAAIAQANGLTVLTRNLKHFSVFGTPTHDPFRALPD